MSPIEAFVLGCCAGAGMTLSVMMAVWLCSSRPLKSNNPEPLQPWDMTPEQSASAFRQVRDGIPVDEEEIARARPARKALT